MSFGHRPPISDDVIRHIRSAETTDKTLCGRAIGRVYDERPGSPATCKKCIRLRDACPC